MDTSSRLKVIKAKKLIDGTGAVPKEDVAIVISGNTIQKIIDQSELTVLDGAEVIDLGESTVMPGMIDAHMHFFAIPSHQLYRMHTESEVYRVLRAAGEAKKMLEAGITTARCLGSTVSPDLKRAIDEGHVPGPRLVVAGEFVISTGGTWDDVVPPHEFADGVEGVRHKVRERVYQGVNVIKIGLSKGRVGDHNLSWGDDPWRTVASYALDEVRALTEEAHLNQLKVSAHCIGDEAVRLALDGNVDVIEHGYAISDETRKRLVETQIPVVSTISQLYFHEQAAERFHYATWEREVFKRHMEAMKADFAKGLEEGVKYVLGTDLIGYPTHPQDQAAKEFELAVDWGMAPMQAIVAGTQLAAEVLDMDDAIGTVEEGKLADIIGFAGDPLVDIACLQHVDFVMQDGNVIMPGEGTRR